MSQDKEREIKLQFLDEAQEYLDRIESGLLGISTNTVEHSSLDNLLRAAHSLKGGAAMMGFTTLSHLAHRLEDFFKVLKAGKRVSIDGELEKLLLLSVDSLRQIVASARQGTNIDLSELENIINPIFEQLHQRIGDLQPEDTNSLLSEEAGEDMRVLLFQTEVESCLQRLEAVLQQPEQPCLREEFIIAAQELGCLGEMLELSAFTSFCSSIVARLEATPEQTEIIAQMAIQQLRRSQALVFIGRFENLPEELNLTEIDATDDQEEEILDDALDALLESDNFQQVALNLLSSLEPENITPQQSVTPIVSVPPLETKTTIFKESDNTIRVAVDQIEQLSDLFGELTIERNGLDLQLKRLKNLVAFLKKRVKFLDTSNSRLRNAYDTIANQSQLSNNLTEAILTNSLTSEFDLLEMDRYNDLHLISGEIMETIVQIQEITSDLEINVEETDRTTRDLNRTAKLMQTSITQVRMRPLSDLLARFPRALRDMSLQYGKQVELKVKGGATLIDKIILEALNEPLLHLLRNAFDHGIEDPNTRRAKGKPEQGLIEINATYRGNQTVIVVRDDGRGIDVEKIRAKVKQMGLDTEQMLAASDKELLELIFEPGFSTAEQVTDLSGRGVGMDVVRTNLRQVKGEIKVDTVPEKGTIFTITVPFTLSIVRVLLVETAKMLFAVPTNAVEEMLLLQPEMILLSAGKEVLNWEGYMVPLIRLSQCFNQTRPHQDFDTETVPLINQPIVLLVAQGENLVGLQVDFYWGEQEVTIRQVEGTLKMPHGFTGCTILGDGRVVPLIDCIEFLSYYNNVKSVPSSLQKSSPDQLLLDSPVSVTTFKPAPQSTQKVVMVVDDSINVRRFLALTLEKAGYRVEQAKDGQEALEKLLAGIKPSSVVCDIEMPRVDGFGFLAQVKSVPGCDNLPVVMLTSRSGDKHRQLALHLGAKGYLTKPFKEQELLETLEKLTIKQLSTV